MAPTPTNETFDQIKGIVGTPIAKASNTVTVATGLTAYDLQAPAKNLYPVNTPLRNVIKRVSGIGPATNWRAVTGITGGGYDSMGWVAEGQRAAAMSLTVEPKTASFRTLGEEAAATYEAVNAGRGFEDIRATNTMRLLQKMMMKEEHAILGGNASLALGVPSTPTLAAVGTGGTLASATYSVIVVALTFEGLKNSSVANGVATSQTITGQDGLTYTLKGGSSNKSAAATQAIVLGENLDCSVTPIRGAMGYAWYVGLAGAEKLQAITTVNVARFSAPLETTTQAATAITADNSRNDTMGFDGLLYNAYATGSGAYFYNMATGSLGAGVALTATGTGGIVEIDNMFETMWNDWQVSPSILYVHAQQLRDISKKTLTGGANAIVRFNMDVTGEMPTATAGQVVGTYFNPFSVDGGTLVPIKIHPFLPSGTVVGWADNLPVQYQSSEVPDIAEMIVRQDYYQIDWPLTTRSYQQGVYVEEVLANYFPPAMGVITNIGAGS